VTRPGSLVPWLPVTGAPIAATGNQGTSDPGLVTSVSAELAADSHPEVTQVMVPLAVIEILAVILVPPLVYPWLRRRFRGVGQR